MRRHRHRTNQPESRQHDDDDRSRSCPTDYNAVRVYTTKPHHDIVGEFKFQDVTFDLIAIC